MLCAFFAGLCKKLLIFVLFRAEYKPRGYFLEHFWQADLGYIGQAIIGVKVPNSSHVACIQHGRVAVSSATTSTLVVEANEIPHLIKGIIKGVVGVVDKSARSGR